MNEDVVLSLGHEALTTMFMLSAPILIVAMIVGIAVSIVQAITQINEATLTFIPKIIAIAVVLVVSGPWMIDIISHYTTDLFTHFPELIH